MEPDPCVMTFRKVELSDLGMVQAWAREHDSEPIPEEILPPLGVMVTDAEGPAAAMWCYESFGVGVAFLKFPVTRPGLTLARARAVITRAIEGCIALAGTGAEPPGEFTRFFVTVAPTMVPFLDKFGFKSYSEPQQPMIYVHGS